MAPLDLRGLNLRRETRREVLNVCVDQSRNAEAVNVLVFVSSDNQCDNRDLVAVMTGNLYIDRGGAERNFSAYSDGRIKEEKFAFDLYLSFDVSNGEDQKGFH